MLTLTIIKKMMKTLPKKIRNTMGIAAEVNLYAINK
jgi:hypothetical protein